MFTPFVTSRVAALHQDALHAEAQYARRVAQCHGRTPVSVKETVMQTLMQTLTTRTQSFVRHPRAVTAVALAVALVASVLLGVQDASAGAVIHGRP
jgi:hypothetical protein